MDLRESKSSLLVAASRDDLPHSRWDASDRNKNEYTRCDFLNACGWECEERKKKKEFARLTFASAGALAREILLTRPRFAHKAHCHCYCPADVSPNRLDDYPINRVGEESFGPFCSLRVRKNNNNKSDNNSFEIRMCESLKRKRPRRMRQAWTHFRLRREWRFTR